MTSSPDPYMRILWREGVRPARPEWTAERWPSLADG
jgi:hypothetical protein